MEEKNLVTDVPDVIKVNSDLLLKYIEDMEHGLNVSMSSTKGGRGYPRLNTLREKIRYFAMKFDEIFGVKDLTKITEEQAVLFFSKMKKGEITRKDGKRYTSTDYFVKVFKAFWHWHQNINRKQGISVPDITVDLDSKGEKPKWVYLTEEQVKKLFDNAKPKYKPLIMFLFDTGIRAPTELINIKVSDFHNDCKELHIRDEVSKTFGRRIKLMLCSDLIRDYVKENKLQPTDYIFPIKPSTINKYLKRLTLKVFGETESLAGEKYCNMTMYDFRHVSCCYWLPRYKSESTLKYRFGWKKSDKIHYYSELLGMKDTITEDDMFVDITKTDLEKQLNDSNHKREMLQEQVQVLEEQMVEMRNKLLGVREKI